MYTIYKELRDWSFEEKETNNTNIHLYIEIIYTYKFINQKINRKKGPIKARYTVRLSKI